MRIIALLVLVLISFIASNNTNLWAESIQEEKCGRAKRILFLIFATHSRFKEVTFYFTELPVGIGYLAECAVLEGFEVDVCDMNLGYTLDDLIRRIRRFKPETIASQMFSVRYKEAYEIFEILKEHFPDVTILVGGAHPSVFREKVLEDCYAIDLVVYGEGEIPFKMLCSGMALEMIPGIIYRKDGKIIINPSARYILDLDSIPFPRYQRFELDKFFRHSLNKIPKISICGSRGCPYQCTYCAAGSIMGNRYRYRSIENILDEIEYWYSQGIRYFSFVDDVFTYKANRVFEFCDGIERRKLSGCAFSCDNGVRADLVTRQMLARMREVGFWRVGVGGESGNEKVLRLLKKGERVEQIRETLKNLIELHYSVMLYFLVGSPGETIQDLEDSFKLANEFPVDDVAFTNIVPYPGTELYEYLKGHGLLLKKPEDYLNEEPRHINKPIFETFEMPLQQRKKALKRAFAVERLVVRKGMRRRLHKIGIFADIFAFFYGFPNMRACVMSNMLFRKIVLNSVKKIVHMRY